MELKKVTKESRRIGFIILFLSVFMGFKPAIAQENIKEVELNVEDTTVFSMEEIEQKPEFSGGDEALRKFFFENLNYPREARGVDKKGRRINDGIQGCVIIGFLVEKDGSLYNFTVVKSVATVLDEEALRVLKLMPKWVPGKYQNKVVRVKCLMPIEFKLN